MQVNFEILSTVVFQHHFFKNNRLECLSIFPSQESERVMLNNGLIFKHFKDGFTLLFQTNLNGDERSRGEVGVANHILRFYLVLKDSNFYNYTESGMESLNKSFYYFHNISEKRKNTESTNYLHEAEYVSSDDVLTQEQHGELPFQKPFAMVDIIIDSALQSEYVISFKQKKCYWRYILMGEYLNELHKPSIVGEDVLFNGPYSHLLPNKNAVVYFESNKPIGLSQIPTQYFKLVDNYEDEALGHRVVIRQLPTPNVETISRIKENSEMENTDYLEIFIY